MADIRLPVSFFSPTLIHMYVSFFGPRHKNDDAPIVDCRKIEEEAARMDRERQDSADRPPDGEHSSVVVAMGEDVPGGGEDDDVVVEGSMLPTFTLIFVPASLCFISC